MIVGGGFFQPVYSHQNHWHPSCWEDGVLLTPTEKNPEAERTENAAGMQAKYTGRFYYSPCGLTWVGEYKIVDVTLTDNSWYLPSSPHANNLHTGSGGQTFYHARKVQTGE